MLFKWGTTDPNFRRQTHALLKRLRCSRLRRPKQEKNRAMETPEALMIRSLPNGMLSRLGVHDHLSLE